ncbi:hypothetical protein FPY71_11615 [Aureimonas fodinaquatilis]|uniref:Secreted protein n=1 Tax=Aureimonas fodinaquatilis TaxID=2565783 RepID=A0A5B0DX55_9HYPH|nr:hypothetical protein [Aureimonas fodinaquatilis]KAA0971086.1 hypothetical protein FPY71_11615 [Aureimonas fodinaquatilis]
MKTCTTAVLATILAIGLGGTATAKCHDDQASISKDGSMAPLQTPDTTQAPPQSGQDAAATTGAESGSNAIAKDGSTMPLAPAGQDGSQVATSPQDVQSQQEGEKTAAEMADEDCPE